jgi:hypothetical protein
MQTCFDEVSLRTWRSLPVEHGVFCLWNMAAFASATWLLLPVLHGCFCLCYMAAFASEAIPS